MMVERKFENGYVSNEILSNPELYEAVRLTFGFNFVTGLPCGELRDFIAQSSRDREVLHFPASNEREAIGIAAGAWLAGEKPVVYMQNSGLFLSSNDIGSLLIACRIPVVMVVAWRGASGETATQHLATGAATEPLLEAFGIPFSYELTLENIEQLFQQMTEQQKPVCILRVREKFNVPIQTKEEPRFIVKPEHLFIEEASDILMNRDRVIDLILSQTGSNTAVFSSTGLISRSVFERHDGPNQFYNAGAFGLTSSIGLGFAISQIDIQTVILEGDGSVLANPGNLNLIGAKSPDNFIHIVLDNRAYMSCSGEATCRSELIPKLASLYGYSKVFSVYTENGFQRAWKQCQEKNLGPQMIHVNINQIGERNLSRPVDMANLARRFKSYFLND